MKYIITEKDYADEFLEEDLNDFQSLDRFMKVNRSRRFDTTIVGNTYYAMSFSSNNQKNVTPPHIQTYYALCIFRMILSQAVYFTSL